MSIIGSNILAGAAGSGVSAYEIEQSLRFDGSSYLSRTYSSAGNRKTFTISVWVKRSTFDGDQYMFGAYQTGGASQFGLRFYNTGGNETELLYDQGAAAPGGGYGFSQAKYRDASAWYHIVYAADYSNATASDRIRLYVNNERVTEFRLSSNGIDSDGSWNWAGAHYIGRDIASNTNNLKGYMAEVNFVDGTAVTNAEDFGEYDDNGVWRPKRYTGSYGTNGFYLKFDPSATNGIGHDHSGNGNNWTASGFTTSGTGTDVMSDTPTTNWATLNPLHDGAQVGPEDGNLKFAWSSTGNYHQVATATIGMPGDGKWYWEVTKLSTRSDSESIGILREDGGVDQGMRDGQTGTPSYSYEVNGTKNKDASASSYGASYAQNDVIGVAVDLTPGGTSGTITFYKNGTSQGVAYSDIDTSYTWLPAVDGYGQSPPSEYTLNFGQRDFEYTPPTGFLPLNTANLPAPDIADGSEYFQTVTYTGTGATRDITVADNSSNAWQPDLVWIKNRDIADHHALFDPVRGVLNYISSNRTNAEAALANSLTAFNTDGFELGSANLTNFLNQAYVAWNWLAGNGTSSNTDGSITSTVSANPTAGFSIVSYTGTGANATVGHGLGVAPQFFFGRNRDDTGGLLDWIVYHESVGNTARLKLNTTGSTSTSSTFFQNTSPSSTVFSIGTSNDINKLNDDYIMYCFAEVEGYSKFGSYTGNGSSDGPFVYCGFRPAWLMIKDTTGSLDAWYINDNKRNTYNVVNGRLMANLANDEATALNICDFTANGFKIRTNDSGWNTSSSTYIFVAFAENPFGGSGVSPACAR